jgi:regulator of sirC expression with transglutaminase-like and TPR domain
MLQSLPNDVLEHVCAFLVNDGISIGRLSLCSRSLYQHLARENPDLWKGLMDHRWTTTSARNHDDADDHYAASSEQEVGDGPRRAYWRRYALDQRAREILEHMTLDLKQSLQLPEDVNRMDGNYHIGQAWDHLMWKELLTLGGNVLDFLREQAQKVVVLGDDDTTKTNSQWSVTNDEERSIRMNDAAFGFDDRLRSFLAARSLQTIQFAECLYEWKAIQELQQDQQGEEPNAMVDPALNTLLLERYTLLVSEIQQTPDQLVLRRDGNLRQSVVRRLDRLAEACQEQIQERESSKACGSSPHHPSLGILDKIQIINNCLFQQEGFKGNSDDYYNYRNSLLDCVLDSKMGIPITLAILYTCICRRLGLDVYLVGLPGHVVLGFSTNEDSDNNPDVQFLDVFREGKLLSVQDCRRICLSYNVPFFDKYIEPLPAHQVLQRILNNLANCHFHGMATGNELFHSDLFYHQRALASIHSQPPGNAAPLVDRVTQELPLTLSPDLLRFYGLLSPSRVLGPLSPTITATLG